MKKLNVTCIIPAYNAEQTIRKCLESVIQTPGIKEIIIIDDGSNDNTANEIKKVVLLERIPIRLFQQNNKGPGAARNIGFLASSSEWVTFLDADDEMLPDSISSKFKHLSMCKNNNEIDAVYGSFIRSDNGKLGAFSVTLSNVDRNNIGKIGGYPGGMPCYIFKKNILLKIGGVDSDLKIFEDFEIILRCIESGGRIVGCTVPGFIRNYTPESLSRGTSLYQKLQIERQFLSRAIRGNLMSYTEINRRLLRNRIRQLYSLIIK